MRLPEDKPEYCQCHYEKSAQEGECGSSELMICSECLLPPKPVDTTLTEHFMGNTTVLPSEKVVYNALSRYKKKLKKSSAGSLEGEEIERFINKKKYISGVKEIVAEYGTSAMCVVARILIQKQVFEFPIAERHRRFPELFPKPPSTTGDELPNQHAADTNQEDTSGELCCTEADQEYSDKAVDTISIQERAGMERLKLKVWHRDHLYAVPLPPKAQHRLMVKLQQVMEHACYDFAQREMQKTLDDKEWNHPEAVELDHWMNILIGHDSFDTNKSTEELEALFLSGIEIRDVAVQRTSFGPGRTRELLHNAADILKVLKVGDYLEVVEKLRSDTEQALGQLYLTTMIKRMSIEKERAEIAAELEKLEQRKERLDLMVYSSVNECQDIAGCQIMEAIEAVEAGLESTGY